MADTTINTINTPIQNPPEVEQVIGATKTQAEGESNSVTSSSGGGIPPCTVIDQNREATLTQLGPVVPPDPAWAQYEQDLAAWEQLKASKEALDAANAQIDKDLVPLEEAFTHLNALLCRHEFDLVLTEQEVKDLARAGEEPLKSAAQWLMAHPDVWGDLPKKDTLVGGPGIDMSDGQSIVANYKRKIDELKAKKMPAPADLPPKPTPPGAPSTPGTGTGAAPNAPGTSNTQSGPPVESAIPQPTWSTQPGMEGATENLALSAEHLQQQMLALAKEASADPTKATLNAQKIAMLQNQFQAVTNMMNQLTQMMSNMSKMWSDVAMNSIRNLK